MNCIDAIEGTAKSTLTAFMGLSTEYRMDLTEYIRNVKAVIDGAVLFLEQSPEVGDSPDILRDVLSAHAKSLWMADVEKQLTPADPAAATAVRPDLEYQSYCYDYVYDRGEYPR